MKLGLTIISFATALFPTLSTGSILVVGLDDFFTTTVEDVTTATDGSLAATSFLSGGGFRAGSDSGTGNYGGDPAHPAGGVGNGRYGLSTISGGESGLRSASVTIGSPLTYTESFLLDSLVFDAAIRDPDAAPTLILEVSYRLNSAAVIPLGFAAVTSGEYNPLVFSVAEILNPGDTISFFISQLPGQNSQIIIDNIGLFAGSSTVIPEPSTALLGAAFLGIGVMVRSRRP